MEPPSENAPAPRARPELWPRVRHVLGLAWVPLTASLVSLAEDVDFLNESGGTEFLTIPIQADADTAGG